MIKINDKKTAIVGGVVGIVMLLTIFCCEGKKEAGEAVPAEAAVEEVVPAVEKAVEELKAEVKEVIEEVTPEVEEVVPATEKVTPAETVE